MVHVSGAGRALAAGPRRADVVTRYRMTREQVLQFRDTWDDGDRRQLRAFLDGDGSRLAYKDDMEPRRREIDAWVAQTPDRLHHLYRTDDTRVREWTATTGPCSTSARAPST